MQESQIALSMSIVILIMFSAYFSSTETAFSSLNKIRLKNLMKNDVKGAALAYELSEKFDKVLSTILIGNNIVNIVSASLATVLFTSIMKGNESAAVGVSTAVMTILVLIFGEITPKTLAKEYPEKFAIFSAPILRFFMFTLTPLNYPFTLFQKLLGKIFDFEKPQSVSDEELITMIEDAEEKGGLNEYESELICSAIEFDDCEVSEIMTSRLDIVAMSKSLTMEEIRSIFSESRFSRIPVYEENLDQIIGFIHERDFYEEFLEGKETIEDIIKPIYATVPKTKISKLFRKLQNNKSHICMVVDEFGSTLGIVTIEDIIEELVGEIWDEHEEVVSDFENVSDNRYTVLCSASLESFFENFDKTYDKEKYEDIQTVSGWVTHEFGQLPKVGDSFTYENLFIKVSKIDYYRIIEIEVEVNV